MLPISFSTILVTISTALPETSVPPLFTRNISLFGSLLPEGVSVGGGAGLSLGSSDVSGGVSGVSGMSGSCSGSLCAGSSLLSSLELLSAGSGSELDSTEELDPEEELHSGVGYGSVIGGGMMSGSPDDDVSDYSLFCLSSFTDEVGI